MTEETVTDGLEVLLYQASKKGKSCCGDSYIVIIEDDYALLALADGLGSGDSARESSATIKSVIEAYHHEDVYSLLNRCNESLKNMRGAAVAIAKIYFSAQEVVYACVGNIRFLTLSPSGKVHYPLPKAGYLSGKPQTFLIQRFPYVLNSIFLMNTDGIQSISSKELTLYQYNLQLLVNVIKQRNNYEDDATVLVGKIKQ
jgi:phosphoserine phosphatase RsbX